MFELPEYVNFARQMNATLPGKVVTDGALGNQPHKFVWYNRAPEEFAELTRCKRVGEAQAKGRWLFVALEPGYLLTFGECGGRLLYHPAGTPMPEKYHLAVRFADGSGLSAMTAMWGSMELFEQGKERERQYIKDMRVTPNDPDFSFDYFSKLIDELAPLEKRSVKSLLTQDQLIPGLGNSSAQDILFHARLHPRHPITELDPCQRRVLYDAIVTTVEDIIAAGGRNDELDFFGKPGGYRRMMDKNAVGQPCPACGGPVEKIQYLGGACYFCPCCQK
ncbi:MAG TPA: DNA-formamidopyrimidine glycosylase family protein [Anaerolineaceae bacterium]|nr:DNA-formamidopyrimidine glycosylase family protein [Anaerolineaceae bacterium]